MDGFLEKSRSRSRLRQALVILALAAVYVGAARLGLLLALPPERKVTAVWPPSGIALAALLLLGVRVWPGVWLGAFLANLWDAFQPGNPFPLATHLLVSAGIATGSTLQAAAGKFLIERWIGSAYPFQRASHAWIFAGVSMLMCLIAATLGVASLILGGVAPSEATEFLWWTWWLGDTTGILTAGSAVLIWRQPIPREAIAGRRLEAVCLFATMSALAAIVFGILPSPFRFPAPLAYLTIPFLVFATFRFGRHGAATSLLLISGFAVVGTALGKGPFSQPTTQASLALLQLFMGVIAVTGLVMAAVLNERRVAEVRLAESEALKSSFMETALDCIIGIDRDGLIIQFNPSAERTFGYRRAEAIGRPLAELIIPPSLRGRHSRGMSHFLATGEGPILNRRIEVVAMRRDGRKFPVELAVTTTTLDGAPIFTAYLRDISEKKQAEQAARRSERRLEMLANTVPALVYYLDLNRRYVSVNNAFTTWFDVPREQVVGQSKREFVGEEVWSIIGPKLDRAFAGETVAFETIAPFRLGGTRWIRPVYKPHWDADGRVIGVLAYVADITQDREAQERLLQLTSTLERKVEERTQALKESERRFRAIFHSQFQFIGVLSPEGVVLEANHAALTASGVPEESVVGKPFWETVWWAHDPKQAKRLREAIARAARGERDRFEASHPTADGGIIWVDFSLTPYFDDVRKVAFLIPEGRDISERKQAEDALRLQEERFRSAFDHAPIGVALVATSGKWLRVNRSLREIVGYTEEELLASDFQSITHPDDLPSDFDRVRDMLAGTIGVVQCEKRYIHKRGHVVHVQVSVSLVRDAKDKPHYFIAQIKDITQRKEADDRLRSSLREKEALLKEIHHRVKNNLQIVSTLLELQSDQTQDRQALDMFQESRGRVKSMALIHERLYRSQDLARVHFSEYIRQLAEDVYRAYKVSDDEITLSVEVSVPPLPLDFAIPCGLLIYELISNCLKHAFEEGEPGWIRVMFDHEGTNATLKVADNGVGFPPGFDFRATSSFGLQLVTTLVEQLRGEVALNTEGSSEWVVTFPMPEVAIQAEHP